MLILLSDGRGTLHGGDPAAIATANQIRAAGTRIIAVGLSTSVSTDTIESMASEPTAAFSYIYSSIAEAPRAPCARCGCLQSARTSSWSAAHQTRTAIIRSATTRL